MFGTVTTLSAQDVMLQELHIEASYLADAELIACDDWYGAGLS
jgi:hypothetical protein